MNGYWKNKGNGGTPGQGGGVEIGLPPCISGTMSNQWIDGLYVSTNGWNYQDYAAYNVRAYKKTLNPGSYLEPDYQDYKDGDYHMYLPGSFKGYITEAEEVNTGIYKTNLKNQDLTTLPNITEQKVYKIGIDVYKLVRQNLHGPTWTETSLYQEVEKMGAIFQNYVFDDSNIPVFTGSFRSGGGGTSLYTMKQNRHYAGSGSAARDLLGPGMMMRYFIFGNNFYNTSTYGSGALDTQFSNGSAEGGVLRSGFTTPTANRALFDWGQSGTNMNILPWFVNFCNCRVTYDATNGNVIDTLRPRITPPTSRAGANLDFDLTQVSILSPNALDNYGLSRYGYTADSRSTASMVLPKLPSNMKIYGGLESWMFQS